MCYSLEFPLSPLYISQFSFHNLPPSLFIYFLSIHRFRPVSLCLFVSLFLCLSVSLSLSLSLCLSLSLSLSVCMCLCVFVSVCVCKCLPVSIYKSINHKSPVIVVKSHISMCQYTSGIADFNIPRPTFPHKNLNNSHSK